MIFIPTDIPGCQIWLDGADVSSMGELSSTGTGDVTNYDPVGLWKNKATFRDFSSSGVANSTRPTYIESLSSLNFNNAQYLTFTGNIDYNEQTILMVARPTGSIQAADTLYSQARINEGDTASWLPLQYESATNLYTYFRGSQVARTLFRGISAWDIYTALRNNTGIFYYINGGSTGYNAHIQNLGFVHNVFRSRIGAAIGSTGSANWFFTGEIAEVIVYNRSLTITEYADVQGYLQRKWSFLNQFPRAVYALKDGLWSDSTVWSISGEPAPFNTILSTDDVFTNSYSVIIDQHISASSLRTAQTINVNTINLNPLSGGGQFMLTEPYTLTVSQSGIWTGSTTCLTTNISSTGTVIISGDIINTSRLNTETAGLLTNDIQGNIIIYGNVAGGSNATQACGIICNNSGDDLTVFGQVLGGNGSSNRGGTGIRNNSSRNLNIVFPNTKGDIAVGGANNNTEVGIQNNSTGNCSITGNVIGFWTNGYGIHNRSNGNITITGNVSGGVYGTGIYHEGESLCTVNGNVYGGWSTNSNPPSHGIFVSNLGTVLVNGDVFGHMGNGIRFQENTEISTCIINGDIYASPEAAAVQGGANTHAFCTSNFFNSHDGFQAIAVPVLLITPRLFNSYTVTPSTIVVNLLRNSETFIASYTHPILFNVVNSTINVWNRGNSTVVANITSGPTQFPWASASILLDNTSNGVHNITQTTSNIQVSANRYETNTLTFSVYGKARERRYMLLSVDQSINNGANAFSAIFDLQTGNMSNCRSNGSGVLSLSSIESLNNGWYRCTISGTIGSGGTGITRSITSHINISDRDNYGGTLVGNMYPSYASGANALSGIIIWGPQLQYGSATPYVSSGFFQGVSSNRPDIIHYAPEAYNFAYLPNVSSVRIGTTFCAVSVLSGIPVDIPALLEGTMYVPSLSVVSLGTLVDNVTGIAILNANSLQNTWNTPINTINTPNSIGVRLKNIATLPDIGEQIGSINI